MQQRFDILLLISSLFWMAAASAQEIMPDTLFIDDMESLQADIMRFSQLQLRDPHLFADALFCVDVTSEFNEEINASLNEDNDADGLLDASPLLLLEPFAPPQVGRLAQAEGACTAPAASTQCSILLPAPANPFAVSSDGLCRSALADTTSGYQPPVPSIAAPCFSDRRSSRSVMFDGLVLSLQQAVIAGSYDSAEPAAINAGLLRGFVSETAAEAVIIPADVPLIGGQPLAALLPGGAKNCAAGDDRDSLDGVSGWWFYFFYQADLAAAL